MKWNAVSPLLAFTGMLFSLFISLLCDMAIHWCLKEPEKLYITSVTGMVVTAVFTGSYGFSFTTLRCVLLCYFLMLAGAADFATCEIPDIFHLLIVLAGLIGFRPLPALLGLLLVPLPFLAAALKTGKIGGGDVKLMAASGFALGVSDGFRMMFWGLLTALLWNLVVKKDKKCISLGKRSVPLAPFLAFGCFVALLPVSGNGSNLIGG